MRASMEELISKLKTQIATNRRQTLHALEVLCRYQSDDEIESGETKHRNGIGFNKYDADICTSIGKQFKLRGNVSEKQLKCLQKVLPKYSEQLINHSISCGKINKCADEDNLYEY